MNKFNLNILIEPLSTPLIFYTIMSRQSIYKINIFIT
nr:MAG TPA: hypothetical protein [Bacteriophage sp.]